MTFWDFADRHPLVTFGLACILLLIVENVCADIVRCMQMGRKR